jgi:hypothetical protein
LLCDWADSLRILKAAFFEDANLADLADDLNLKLVELYFLVA